MIKISNILRALNLKSVRMIRVPSMSESLKKAFKQFKTTVYYVVQFGCVAHCVNEYVASLAFCYGPSMEPTIKPHNMIVCEHVTPLFRNLTHGDIVIAKSVTNPIVNVCKRITGMPGDILLSGSRFVRVPEGHVWLQGDNESESSDSRNYGPVPMALIKGRVSCRIWPIKDVRIFWPGDMPPDE